MQYAVLPGPHSVKFMSLYNKIYLYVISKRKLTLFSFQFYKQDYFYFVSAIEGTLVLRKPLDYETLSNFSIGIRAQVSVFSIYIYSKIEKSDISMLISK